MKARYLDFLYGLGVFNIKLGLDRIRRLLARLDGVERHPRIIHIAGTNGKGSTLVAIESLLLRSGFSTGSTVSPHLMEFNERFRINGQAVSDEMLNEAFCKVCKACGIDTDRLDEYRGGGRLNPTFFEFSLAMAFVIFRRYGVDYILLETGLGGRLDATNVVQDPLACVFTRIALDHEEYLGKGIEAIANEKLGILKPGATAFIAKQEPAVAVQIKHRCREKGNRFLAADENFACRKTESGLIYGLRSSSDPNALPVPLPISIDLGEIGLRGVHQLENIATALTLYLSLVPEESQLDREEIDDCFRTLQWPARMQYLDAEKRILLDGAHNVSGMSSLVNFIRRYHAGDSILFAVCWMEGKEILPALRSLPVAGSCFQPLKMEQCATGHLDRIERQLREEKFEVLPMCDIAEFVRRKLPVFLQRYDLVVVAGSLYLIGEFLAEHRRREPIAV